MRQHLNSEQILECLIGAGDREGQLHARECAACRAETESMAKPLAWFRASFQHVELTSRPVTVPEIWGSYGGQGRRAGAMSILIHVSFVGLLFLLGTDKTVQQMVRQQVQLIAPYQSTVKKNRTTGGGGGGARSPAPANKGKLPKLATKQFVPPMISHVENPKLVMDPTLIMQPDANIPKVNTDQLGDPLAKSGLA